LASLFFNITLEENPFPPCIQVTDVAELHLLCVLLGVCQLMSYGDSLKQPSKVSTRNAPPSSAASAGTRDTSGGKLRNLTMQEPRSRDGRTELELLQATTRSLAETDEIANGALGTLNHQTEQIERIKGDTEAISQNLDTSDRLLKEMRPFGWLKKIFDPRPRETQAISATNEKDSTPPSVKGAQPSGQGAQPSRGAQRLLEAEAARRNGGGTQAGRRDAEAKKGVAGRSGGREEQVEKAYDTIDNLLEGLKVKSKEINRTIDNHNEMLAPITASIEKDQARVSQQQREIKKRIEGR